MAVGTHCPTAFGEIPLEWDLPCLDCREEGLAKSWVY